MRMIPFELPCVNGVGSYDMDQWAWLPTKLEDALIAFLVLFFSLLNIFSELDEAENMEWKGDMGWWMDDGDDGNEELVESAMVKYLDAYCRRVWIGTLNSTNFTYPLGKWIYKWLAPGYTYGPLITHRCSNATRLGANLLTCSGNVKLRANGRGRSTSLGYNK